MAEDGTHLAVLMGDIAGSERQADAQRLHLHFNAAIDRRNRDDRTDIISPLTITLGDEFQGVLTSMVAAASIARAIRFDLMTLDIDCRFVIGLVEVKTPLNREKAWNMLGPGFAAARERLNEKRSPTRYSFSIGHDPVLETLLNASGASLTAIEQRWSDIQRDDILKLLAGKAVADVAQDRNVSVFNVYKVRHAGNFDLYRTQWAAINKALTALDRQYSLPGAETWRMRSLIPV